jgi:hypothetical protein
MPPITTVIHLMNMLGDIFKRATGYRLPYHIGEEESDLIVEISLGEGNYIIIIILVY